MQGTGPGLENEGVIHVSAQLLRWGVGVGGSRRQSGRWSDAMTPGDTESPGQDPGHPLLSPGIWFLVLQ